MVVVVEIRVRVRVEVEAPIEVVGEGISHGRERFLEGTRTVGQIVTTRERGFWKGGEQLGRFL